MKFKVTNLGCIESAELELGKLTLLSGENNTGKTYLTYALYGFLFGVRDNWRAGLSDDQLNTLRDTGSARVDLNELADQIPARIKELCVAYKHVLPSIFGAGADSLFNDATFHLMVRQHSKSWERAFEARIGGERYPLIFKKEAGSPILEIVHAGPSNSALPSNPLLDQLIGQSISDILLGDVLPSPHALTAERAAISVFWRDIDSRKVALVEALQNPNDGQMDPFDLMNRMVGKYSSAIKSNIAVAGNQSPISKEKSFIADQHQDILELFGEIAGGKYKHQEKIGFQFKPKGRGTPLLHLFLASSSARSLFGLALYLGYQAKPGDILMIDEPELNLHPRNQLKMAELLVRLVGIGVRVFVTTHSDYIIKQINSMMMRGRLGQATTSSHASINPDDVRYYWAEGGTARLVEKDIFGFVKTPFDDAIDSSNLEQDRLTSQIEATS